MVSWLEIYAPLDRLDSGLLIFLLLWILTVLAGFALWIFDTKPDKGSP